jgi:hypothetical protein
MGSKTTLQLNDQVTGTLNKTTSCLLPCLQIVADALPGMAITMQIIQSITAAFDLRCIGFRGNFVRMMASHVYSKCKCIQVLVSVFLLSGNFREYRGQACTRKLILNPIKGSSAARRGLLRGSRCTDWPWHPYRTNRLQYTTKQYQQPASSAKT